MTTLREAAQQALEFIKVTNARSEFWFVPESNLNKTVKALRAALEQPEQEPVAMPVEALANALVVSRIVHPDAVDDSLGYDDGATMDRIQNLYRRIKGSLYTHPPRREWRGLTEEEKRECAQAMDAEPLVEGWPELVKFARAIEAALKEKNSA